MANQKYVSFGLIFLVLNLALLLEGSVSTGQYRNKLIINELILMIWAMYGVRYGDYLVVVVCLIAMFYIIA